MTGLSWDGRLNFGSLRKFHSITSRTHSSRKNTKHANRGLFPLFPSLTWTSPLNFYDCFTSLLHFFVLFIFSSVGTTAHRPACTAVCSSRNFSSSAVFYVKRTWTSRTFQLDIVDISKVFLHPPVGAVLARLKLEISIRATKFWNRNVWMHLRTRILVTSAAGSVRR